ncbi:MAG TPA: alpha/beta hydrolase [Pyrinomonadaceae bacterium]|jgi:pimeloyl-ACP methyl ester carboxylesterase
MKLFYESHGDGEPLVLIPGFASGAWSWHWQIEDLAKHFRVIAFDPRGVSNSKIADSESVSLETIARDVAALLDELKIEKASVLGASFGGFVAQEFALRFPERLNKMILACTSFGGKNHVAPDLEILLAFASTVGMNTSDRIRNFMIPAFTPEFRAEHAATVEKVCALRERNIVPESVYLAQLRSATTFDAETRAANIKAETLVLTGDADVVVPPQNSYNLAAAIPNATLKVIKGGSHMFFIEKAKEFNEIVSEFLSGQ